MRERKGTQKKWKKPQHNKLERHFRTHHPKRCCVFVKVLLLLLSLVDTATAAAATTVVALRLMLVELLLLCIRENIPIKYNHRKRTKDKDKIRFSNFHLNESLFGGPLFAVSRNQIASSSIFISLV